MLYELKNVTQIEGRLKRRWFADDFFDLIVWLGNNDEIVGFQLCYNKEINEQAFTWKHPSTYTFHRVDDGENNTGSKGTPTLVTGGSFDYRSLAELFQEGSENIDAYISGFVYEKIILFSSSDESKNNIAQNNK